MYCVIMAGGSGTRFWPRSREERSKQFLTIFGQASLIESTLKRYSALVPWKDIYIVTKKCQREELEKHRLNVPTENLIYEPYGKNTAPCIGLAALFVEKRDPDGVMIVSPSDHLIQAKRHFKKTINAGVRLAEEKEGLVTIGIKPERPSTGYGYIQVHQDIGPVDGMKAFSIKTFAEKPNLATAKRFLRSGDFYWNSGIFIFRVSCFLNEVKTHLPDLFDGLQEIKKHIDKPSYEDVLQTVYQQIPNISIDYGIMEKTRHVYLIRGDFGWNDLGSWEQVHKLSPKDDDGNVVLGDAVLVDVKNSYVYNSKGIVAVLGLEDVVVVHEGGATLVCRRDRAEEVKQIVDRLKRKKLAKYR